MRVNGRTFYAISLDARANSIWLANDDISECEFLVQKLKLMDISVEAVITKKCDKQVGNDYKCLTPDTMNDFHHSDVVIIYLGDRYDEWYRIFSDIGYKEGWDFKWIKRYSHDKLRTRYLFDPIIGFNSVGNDDRYPGYNIYGDVDNEEAKRVVIMGASATDPDVFNIKSWPECLFEIASHKGNNIVILNGATTGYTSSQELIKLERDLPALNANIVISFSGMNNNHLVYKHPFFIDYNLKTADYFKRHDAPTINTRSVLPFKALEYSSQTFNKYTYWLNQEKTMRYFCELYNVTFFGILQPNLMSKDSFLPEEKEYLMNRSFMGRFGLTPQDYISITRKFKDVIKDETGGEWLFDLSNIFDNETESVYFDGLHVNEHGNYIIAENIYEIIKQLL